MSIYPIEAHRDVSGELLHIEVNYGDATADWDLVTIERALNLLFSFGAIRNLESRTYDSEFQNLRNALIDRKAELVAAGFHEGQLPSLSPGLILVQLHAGSLRKKLRAGIVVVGTTVMSWPVNQALNHFYNTIVETNGVQSCFVEDLNSLLSASGLERFTDTELKHALALCHAMAKQREVQLEVAAELDSQVVNRFQLSKPQAVALIPEVCDALVKARAETAQGRPQTSSSLQTQDPDESGPQFA